MSNLFINELSRIEALDSLCILDTPNEPAFDRITNIAHRHFGVHISAICFIHKNRLWTKSGCGPAAREIPRETAFCNQTILHDSPFIVNDTLTDANFSSSPFVVGEPHIRFYAGVPLIVGPNRRVGTLCLVDTKPRPFDDADVRYLVGLANVVVAELWLRQATAEENLGSGPEFLPMPSAKYDFSRSEELSAGQLRAARALLDWSIAKLSSVSKISPNTIKRLEARDQQSKFRSSSSSVIRETLEKNNIAFHGTNGVSLTYK